MHPRNPPTLVPYLKSQKAYWVTFGTNLGESWWFWGGVCKIGPISPRTITKYNKALATEEPFRRMDYQNIRHFHIVFIYPFIGKQMPLRIACAYRLALYTTFYVFLYEHPLLRHCV